MNDEPLVDPELEALAGMCLEDLVAKVENEMLAGRSRWGVATWLKRTFGIDRRDANRLCDVVYAMWKFETRGADAREDRAEALRAKYMHVYAKALEENELKIARETLDSVAKLDQLVSPDINLTIANVKVTNQTRSRVAELIDRMRTVAEARGSRIEHKLVDARVAAQKTIEELNAGVIDVGDSIEDEERDAATDQELNERIEERAQRSSSGVSGPGSGGKLPNRGIR